MKIIEIKTDFCGDGVTCSTMSGTSYNYYPKLKISTDRKLTDDERRRVNDALVKAAAVELLNINDEEAK